MKHDEIMYKMANLAQYEAQEMEKSAFVIPGLIGALTAADLSKDDVKMMRKYYGLKPKEGLKSRSFGRSALRGVIAANIGSILGAPLGTIGAGAGAALGTIGGGIYGAQKYSKRNADKIRQELARRKN